jgi:hypothetical protein
MGCPLLAPSEGHSLLRIVERVGLEGGAPGPRIGGECLVIFRTSGDALPINVPLRDRVAVLVEGEPRGSRLPTPVEAWATVVVDVPGTGTLMLGAGISGGVVGDG